MAMRAPTPTSPATTRIAAAAGRSAKIIAATKSRCSSRNDGITILAQDCLSVRGFVLQHRECGQRGVPLDQRRFGSISVNRCSIQVPHVGRDARAMSVDQCCAPPFEAAQMYFRDNLARYG